MTGRQGNVSHEYYAEIERSTIEHQRYNDEIGVPKANLELVDVFLGLRAAALRFFSLVACWTKWLDNGSARGLRIQYRKILTCKDNS